MGLHTHGGTMEGALTPICEACGVSLCWDIEKMRLWLMRLFGINGSVRTATMAFVCHLKSGG